MKSLSRLQSRFVSDFTVVRLGAAQRVPLGECHIIMRRKLSVISALSIVLAALATSMSPAKAAGEVTLSVWTFGDVIQPALLREYRQLHPEVTLNIKKSDLDPLNGTNMVTACAAKNSQSGPDIAAVEISYSGYWRAYPQCFVDLRTMKSTEGGRSATEMKKDYLAWRWENGVAYNGAVIGIPTDVGGLEVAYRWDLFKKAGLPYTRDKVSAAWDTWPKFIEFGKRYSAKLTAAQRKQGVGFMDNAGAIFTAMLNQGTEKYYRNDGTAEGKLVYATNPQVKLAYDTTVKALQANIGTRVSQFSSDWNVGMNTGKFATILAPAWMMDYIKQQAPSTSGKWDIASIPGGGGNQGGTQLTIPSSGKPENRQAAWDFISWYLAPEQQLKVFRLYGLFPSTPSLYTDPSLAGYKDPFFNNAPVGAIYADGVRKLKPLFEGKKQRAIDAAFGNALARVAAKKMAPAASWTKAMTEIKSAVGG